MSKGLITLLVVSLLVLFVIGCKAPTEKPAGEKTGGEVTEEPTLTGGLTEVDNLSTELNDPELENTDAYLDEVTW